MKDVVLQFLGFGELLPAVPALAALLLVVKKIALSGLGAALPAAWFTCPGDGICVFNSSCGRRGGRDSRASPRPAPPSCAPCPFPALSRSSVPDQLSLRSRQADEATSPWLKSSLQKHSRL